MNINNFFIFYKTDFVINPNLRVEKELLQLRANKFNNKAEAHRMEFLKTYDLEKNSNLKIEFSPNLIESFYIDNYANESNVFFHIKYLINFH